MEGVGMSKFEHRLSSSLSGVAQSDYANKSGDS